MIMLSIIYFSFNYRVDTEAFDDVDGPCLIELHDVKLKVMIK